MSSKLLSNGTILAFDADSSSISVLLNAHLLIIDDTIKNISSDLSSIKVPSDTERIDCFNKIISPGFIDTHRHVYQTAWRALSGNTTLSEYFFKYSPWGSYKDGFSSDDIYISALTGYLDALNSGVTTILDHAICTWSKDITHASLRAAADSGARVWWCRDLTNDSIPGRNQDESIAEFTAQAKSVRSCPAEALVKFGVGFDAIGQVDQHRAQSLKACIDDLNLEVITSHVLEGPWPIGNNGASMADKIGLLDLEVPVVFSHAGFISDTDIDLLRRKNHYLSITPESEYHYGHGSVTSNKCQDHASLGIDTAWTFSGDILAQARLWLQSTRNSRYEKVLKRGKLPKQSPMTAEQAFLLATRHGGLALRRDHIGVLRVGAKADIVIFDGDSPNMVGWRDAVAAVVLHANVGDIEGVLVGGEWRKKDSKLVGSYGGKEWPQIKKQFAETARKVQEYAEKTPVEIPDNVFGVPLADTEQVSLSVA